VRQARQRKILGRGLKACSASVRRQRTLAPPKPNGLERTSLDLENGRLFERLLNPGKGLYPKLGNITSGSGFSAGPGYRHVGIFGGHVEAVWDALVT
jgi:hypothetical protein